MPGTMRHASDLAKCKVIQLGTKDVGQTDRVAGCALESSDSEKGGWAPGGRQLTRTCPYDDMARKRRRKAEPG